MAFVKQILLLALVFGLFHSAAEAQSLASCAQVKGSVDIKYLGNGVGYSRWVQYDIKIVFNGLNLKMYTNEGVNRKRNVDYDNLSMSGQIGEIMPEYWSYSCYSNPESCLENVNIWLNVFATADARIINPAQRPFIACAKLALDSFAERVRNEVIQKRNIGLNQSR